MEASWKQLKTESGVMRVYLSLPFGTGPFPGVIIIHNQGGVADILHVTAELASAGYAAVAPDMYYRDGIGCRDPAPTRRARLRDASVITDVNATVDFFKGQQGVDGARLGILGFCMGGRVTYLMAAANPSFKAAVMYYGGGIFRSWGDAPSPFERTAEIHCPTMGHFGEEDENPSPEDVQKLAAELTAHSKVHEFHSYTGAGHAFMNKSRDTYRQHAADLSWPRTIGFFTKHLAG
jgi:carboxymethylenebutenolidase